MKLKRAAVVFPNKRRSALGRATQSEESGSSKGISELWKIALCDMFCIFMNGGIGKVMEKTVLKTRCNTCACSTRREEEGQTRHLWH